MVKGHTYSEQLFENKAFRHFINTFLAKKSGITKGCELNQTSNTMEVGAGFFVIMGGLLEESTGTSLTIPTEAGYYRLVYEIDLSKTNTEAEFNQGNYKFIKGTGSYSGLTQEDLDNDGTVYQFEFCQFRITEAGIQDFADKRTFLDFDSIYQEIDDKIEEIEDGSAFVLKNDINCITAYPSASENNITAADQTITLNASVKVGEKLSLVNNAIKIGQGISKVMISANIYYQAYNSNSAYVFPSVKINNVIKARAIESRSTAETTYQTATINNFLADVQEGDLITLSAGEIPPVTGGKYRGFDNEQLNTYITVQAIK